MSILFTVLTVLVIIASILITLIVLLQNGKGGGLASNFVTGNQTFGVRQTADILEKITWGLAIFIFAVSIISAFTLGGSSSSQGSESATEVFNNMEDNKQGDQGSGTMDSSPNGNENDQKGLEAEGKDAPEAETVQDPVSAETPAVSSGVVEVAEGVTELDPVIL